MNLKEKRLFLLDMDGTVYLDAELFDGTLDFLSSVKELEDACILLTGRDDIDYIATNPDLVCPTRYGYVPDCGSVSIMLEYSRDA